MTYKTVRTGRFLNRPNRFISHVDVDGADTVCHVKNTGRCKELLTPGCTVVLEQADNPNRKTPYDLIAVYKGERLINMDSQAPNAVAADYLANRFPNATIRREVTYGESRFDFYVQNGEEQWLIEVKGCTLERENIGYFPDAPTERGVKHIRELTALAGAGHPAYVLFVVQMKGITSLRPNDETHPAFGEALREAQAAGVRIMAVDCRVEACPMPDGTFRLSVTADTPIPVEL